MSRTFTIPAGSVHAHQNYRSGTRPRIIKCVETDHRGWTSAPKDCGYRVNATEVPAQPLPKLRHVLEWLKGRGSPIVTGKVAANPFGTNLMVIEMSGRGVTVSPDDQSLLVRGLIGAFWPHVTAQNHAAVIAVDGEGGPNKVQVFESDLQERADYLAGRLRESGSRREYAVTTKFTEPRELFGVTLRVCYLDDPRSLKAKG